MIGFIEVIIYLLCIYLVYKGVEIFQIAFTSNPENLYKRKVGVVIGILAIIAAIIIGIGTVFLTFEMEKQMDKNLQNIGNFNRR